MVIPDIQRCPKNGLTPSSLPFVGENSLHFAKAWPVCSPKPLFRHFCNMIAE